MADAAIALTLRVPFIDFPTFPIEEFLQEWEDMGEGTPSQKDYENWLYSSAVHYIDRTFAECGNIDALVKVRDP